MFRVCRKPFVIPNAVFRLSIAYSTTKIFAIVSKSSKWAKVGTFGTNFREVKPQNFMEACWRDFLILFGKVSWVPFGDLRVWSLVMKQNNKLRWRATDSPCLSAWPRHGRRVDPYLGSRDLVHASSLLCYLQLQNDTSSSAVSATQCCTGLLRSRITVIVIISSSSRTASNAIFNGGLLQLFSAYKSSDVTLHTTHRRIIIDSKSLFCIYSGDCGGVFLLPEYLPQTWTDLDETWDINEGSRCALRYKN